MSEQARDRTIERSRRATDRFGSLTSWILTALCCLLLLFYLAAQGRAITLMLRGFASEDILSDGAARQSSSAPDLRPG